MKRKINVNLNVLFTSIEYKAPEFFFIAHENCVL